CLRFPWSFLSYIKAHIRRTKSSIFKSYLRSGTEELFTLFLIVSVLYDTNTGRWFARWVLRVLSLYYFNYGFASAFPQNMHSTRSQPNPPLKSQLPLQTWVTLTPLDARGT